MTMRLSSLRKITDIKGRMTQQATLQYTESLRELEVEKERLREIEEKYEGAVREFFQLTRQSVSAQDLHDWMLFFKSQRAQIEQQHKAVQKQEQVCQQHLDALHERYMDEKKWSRLFERRSLEQQQLLEKLSQNALEEIAVTGRHTRG
jgi:flagellar export protein FliJ